MSYNYKYDHGYSWLVLASSVLCNMLFQSVAMSSPLFLVNFIHAFDISTYYAGWICSIQASILAIGAIVGGMLIDMFSCRSVGFVTALLGGVAIVISSQVKNAIIFMVFYSIIAGIFVSFTRLPPVVIIQYYFDKKRPFATGINVLGYSIGIFGLLPLLALLIEYYGWRGAMMILGGFFLNMCVFTLTFTPRNSAKGLSKLISDSKESNNVYHAEECLPETDKNSKEGSNSEQTDTSKILSKHQTSSSIISEVEDKKVIQSDILPRTVTQQSVHIKSDHHPSDDSHPLKTGITISNIKYSKLSLLKDVNFIMVAISFICFMFSSDIMYKVIVPKVELDMNMGKLKGSALLSGISLASLFSQLVCSCLANLPFVNHTALYALGILIGGAILIMFSFVYNYTVSLALGVIYGIGFGMSMTVHTTLLVDLLGVEHVAHSQGIITGLSGVTYMATLPFSGWMYDNYGSFSFTFLIGGIIQCVGGLISFVLYIKTRNQTGKSLKNIKD